MRRNVCLLTALDNCVGVRLHGLASFEQPDSTFNLDQCQWLPNGMSLDVKTTCLVKVGASTLVNVKSGEVHDALRGLRKHEWWRSTMELKAPVPMAATLLSLASKQELSWGTAEFNRSDCTMTVTALYGNPTRGDRLVLQTAMTVESSQHFKFCGMSAADIEFILAKPDHYWMEPKQVMHDTYEVCSRPAGY
jgi:hypothetical protein